MRISEIQHKDFNKKHGIYKIHCNSYSYIGSSINIYYRLRRHLADLRKDQHANRFLQNLFNKYSENLVTVEILEFIESSDREYIISREKFYIDTQKPTVNSIQDPVCHILSAESKEKISNTLKSKYLNKQINPTNKKPVFMYDLNGEYKTSFVSMREAGRFIGTLGDKIRRSIDRKGSCKGFLWSLTKEDKLDSVMQILTQGKNRVNCWKSLSKNRSISSQDLQECK